MIRLVILALQIIMLFTNTASQSRPKPQILRISTDLSAKPIAIYQHIDYIDLRILIDGIGFDNEEFQNEAVFYRSAKSNKPLNCQIDYLLSTDKLLVCSLRLIDSQNMDKFMDLSLTVRGEAVPCMFNNCRINAWSFNYFTRIRAIWPQTVSPGDTVGFFYIIGQKDLSEKRHIKISGQTCLISEKIRSQYSELYYTIKKHGYYMECSLPESIPTGIHNSVEFFDSSKYGFNKVAPQGDNYDVANNFDRYHLRVRAKVTGMSSSSGYTEGQVISIDGVGFGKDADKVRVRLNSQVDCHVMRVRNDQIQCRLGQVDSQFSNVVFKGGPGLAIEYSSYFNYNYPKNYVFSSISNLKKIGIAMSIEDYNSHHFYKRLYGVFTAKSSGIHTFRMTAYFSGWFYISKSPIDFSQPLSSLEMEEPLEVNYLQKLRNFYDDEENQMIQVNLEANTDYYVAVLNRSQSYSINLSMSMTVPSFDQSAPNNDKRMQEIKIVNEPIFQIVEIVILNATGGEYKLHILDTDPDSGETIFSAKSNYLKLDSSEVEVMNIVQALTLTSTKVKKSYIDANRNTVTDESSAKGIKIRLEYIYFSTRAGYKMEAVTDFLRGDNIVAEVVEVQRQSQGIRGSYILQYGEFRTPVLFFHNAYFKEKIEYGIPLLRNKIEVYTKGIPNEGVTVYIRINAPADSVLPFEVVENNLTGGNNDQNKPPILIDPAYRAETDNLVFTPIPSEFLSTVHDSPQVTVEIDGDRAICEWDQCSYDLLPASDVPQVTQAALNGSTWTLTVDIPQPDEISSERLSVYLGNVLCQSVIVALPTVTCEVPTNPDGSFQLEAGTHTPRVHLDKKGFFKHSATTQPIEVPLAISGVTPPRGSTAGGFVIAITGTGFATDETSSPPKVTLGGGICELVSASNTRIECVAPPQTQSEPLTLVQSGQQVSSDVFEYDQSLTPVISSVTPSSGLVFEGVQLTISGDNFGSDKSLIRVLAVPDDYPESVRDCRITSLDDKITCNLDGGDKGGLSLHVLKQDMSRSVVSGPQANRFSFELEVDAVSPSSGPALGGTLITVTGKNFSSLASENEVFIGANERDRCVVLTSSGSSITCRVSPLRKVTDTFDRQVSVSVRGSKRSDCTGNCQFRFLSDANVPLIESITPASGPQGTEVSLHGKRFRLDQTPVEVTVGRVSASVLSVSSSTIKFSLPDLAFGEHPIDVKFGDMGYAHKAGAEISFSSTFAVNEVSPNSGSKFGTNLRVSGTGFPEAPQVMVGKKQCRVVTVVPTEIICVTPLLDDSNVHSVRILGPQNTEATCASCTFRALELAPEVASVSRQPTDSLEQFTMTLTGQFIKQDSATPPQAYDLQDISVRLVPTDPKTAISAFELGAVSFSGDQVKAAFTNVPGGVYDLVYHLDSVGYAKMPVEARSITLKPSISSVNPVESSWLGGADLRIQGKGFAGNGQAGLTVKVCGVGCEITSSSFGEITCNTPALRSPHLSEIVTAHTPDVITDFVLDGDDPDSLPNLTDEDLKTYYNGAEDSACWFEFDFGADASVKASKISVLSHWKHSTNSLIGGVFEGSMNKADYSLLIAIEEDSNFYWNTYYAPEDGDGDSWEFRYLRFRGNPGGCSAIQVEVVGVKFNLPGHVSVDPESHSCDVQVSVRGTSVDFTGSGAVTYIKAATGRVEGIVPDRGPLNGNTELVITGRGFAFDSRVHIDGVECQVKSINSDSITCTTGAKTSADSSGLIIHSPTSGLVDANKHAFNYYKRWSQPSTWNSRLPQAGESVTIAEDEVVLVDITPPLLGNVTVRGCLLWEDSADLGFAARSLVIEGRVLIGSRQRPHLNKLTMTFHGRPGRR